MRGTTKMMVATSRMQGGSGGQYEMGGGSMRNEAYGNYAGGGMEAGYGTQNRYEMENRRYRRSDNGRFRSGYDYMDEVEAPTPQKREEIRRERDRERLERQQWGRSEMNRIGFAAGGGQQRVVSMHGGAEGKRAKLDRQMADEWTSAMKNEDGSKGPHWSMEQVKQVLMIHNMDDSDPMEYWVAMNAMYSDYCKLAKKYNVNNTDFFFDMAKAFIEDQDAVEDKLAMYYECIVEH